MVIQRKLDVIGVHVRSYTRSIYVDLSKCQRGR